MKTEYLLNPLLHLKLKIHDNLKEKLLCLLKENGTKKLSFDM